MIIYPAIELHPLFLACGCYLDHLSHQVYDGKTGRPLEQPVTVGVSCPWRGEMSGSSYF